MRSTRARAGQALVVAVVIGLASTPRDALAYGSGSGSGAFWDGVVVVGAVGLLAATTVVTVLDVKASADKERISTEFAGGQAGVGGLFALLAAGAIAGNEKKAAPAFFVPLVSVLGAFAGYGIGSLATARPQWWLFSGAAGVTTMAAATGAVSLSGRPHYRATSIAQAIASAPGLAAGLYGATSPGWTSGERSGGWILAGASALTMAHGALDAALSDEPLDWNGEPPPARPSIQVAPQAVSDGQRVVPGIGVVGMF